MQTGQGFLMCLIAKPPASEDLGTIGAPVEMADILAPPSIHPVGAYREVFAEIELSADIRKQNRIIEHIGADVHVEGFLSNNIGD